MDALNLFAACLIAGAQPPCDGIPNPHPRAHLRLTLDQWQPLIDEAATRFGIPATWIRGVMRLESGGHETLNGVPTTSSAGAMGLMQLMPATYAELRIRHGLGTNPYDPRNSVLAGAAYLREMYDAAGAKIVGTYDSMVAFGQSRALVVWQRIIMPNGSSIQIDNLPATNTEGYAGLEDSVDYHTWALIKGVALSTLLGVGTQLSLGNEQDDLLTALRQSAQDSANQAGQQLTQKNLNIQPTIKVRPGWPLRIIVHKDIVLKPYNG